MNIETAISVFFVTVSVLICTVDSISEVAIVPRSEWKARDPVKIEAMPNPVPFVVIHHSYLPPACYNASDCIRAMKSMQDYHQITHSWNDIGYNFAIGGDGRIYEGRGWSTVGAHAPKYNNKSIGICLIGDWRVQLPPETMLALAQGLIDQGVRQGFIAENYQLVGHRTVRKGTECPGNRLMDEIKTWKGYTAEPRSIVEEAKNVPGGVDNTLVNKNKLRKRTVSN